MNVLNHKSYWSISGFQTILQKVGQDDEIRQYLQKLFPSSTADEKVDDMLEVTEAYHNYKKKYARQLFFNPKEEDLSKVVFVFNV